MHGATLPQHSLQCNVITVTDFRNKTVPERNLPGGFRDG